MKNCQLRKRSTYLLLNLAVVDMAVGFTGFWTVYEHGLYCKLSFERVHKNGGNSIQLLVHA